MSNLELRRRELLKGVAVIGAMAGLPLTTAAKIMPILDSVQKSEYPTPDFASITGDTVLIRSDDGEVHKAEVVEVTDADYDCDAHKRPEYIRNRTSIVRFCVANIQSFDNRTYMLKHPSLGEMELLLSVVPDYNGVMGLEAVFN